MTKLNFLRQDKFLDQEKLAETPITIIGAGSIGSFAAMTLAKMGAQTMALIDDDGVSDWNLPNQFYRMDQVGKHKVEALAENIKAFSGVTPYVFLERFEEKALSEVVIVAVDNMKTRKLVWDKFILGGYAKYLIEARMGGLQASLYSIKKTDEDIVKADDVSLYESMLFSDEEATTERCGEQTIIFNVNLIASFICRSVMAYVNQKEFPRELIMDLMNMDLYKTE